MEAAEECGRRELLILQPFQVTHSDLLLLSSSSPSSESESGPMGSIRRGIMDALGPSGPGLLSVTGVQEASALRRKVLPLSRDLALLDRERRARVLKEHRLGTDVPMKDPRRAVSSFAMQLRYGECVESMQEISGNGMDTSEIGCDPNDGGVTREFQEKGFDGLGSSFKELGLLMIEMGLALARVCDQSLGGNELERCLMESGTAKGRLIHYHSATDYLALEKKVKIFSKRRVSSSRKPGEKITVSSESDSCDPFSDLWQQWHYDYGVFTILTAPMFLTAAFPEMDSNEQHSLSFVEEYPYPDGLTYLRILDPTKNDVFMVNTLPENFIIQVGESADVLSRGRLRSTLHCVCRPKNPENVSRETLVVFLQPAWSKHLSLSEYSRDQLASADSDIEQSADEPCVPDWNKKKIMEVIQEKIPPLALRIKGGVSFAEFARETTRQYYGSSGLQSNR
ncbi:hypothetical protein MLD38_026434 [Melastoma candidum]|uniref:Uncharacterized protein n=1 Tax=Melastoma candidum TaxID=119954 RepID=A0ACB9P1U1_9MYRT|nr:hypothetical protein MLD38_026434 [Melastoma candidum]